MPFPYWDNISKNGKDLVRKLLQPDPKRRLTAEQALQHTYLRGICSRGPLQFGKSQQIHLRRYQCVYKMKRGIKCMLAMMALIEVLENEKKEWMILISGYLARLKRKKWRNYGDVVELIFNYI